MPRASTPPPAINREEFVTTRPQLSILLEGNPVPIEAKEFSTGTLGWAYEGTTEILINGEPVKVWTKFLVTINGSKKV